MNDLSLQPYLYEWPQEDLKQCARWKPVRGQGAHTLDMPESEEQLAVDSRWPAFFPSPICLVSTSDGDHTALEKVVGASIVNRFPYVIALSFCRRPLSQRHHVRTAFMEILERGGSVAVQYLPPGPALDRAMDAVLTVSESQSCSRLKHTGLPVRQAVTNCSTVFSDAYMVYEAKLVEPTKDFSGNAIYETPWIDVGSHRVYFLEITAIQLRADIAAGQNQIRWRSLPSWTPTTEVKAVRQPADHPTLAGRYTKAYTPLFTFPAESTVAFDADDFHDGMAVKLLPPLPEDQVEVDNDRARWPCFFPSSAGLITTWAETGVPNVMPCGSTTMISRHPLVIAPCVSYAAINERYAPRATLDLIRRNGRFGCGVPFIHDVMVEAIRYSGNVSITLDREKVANSGLEVQPQPWSPALCAVPIHFECEVIGEVPLGTHVMFLGEVRRIQVRDDVTPERPLEWYPWAAVPDISAKSKKQSC